jgi:hypothetical protein
MALKPTPAVILRAVTVFIYGVLAVAMPDEGDYGLGQPRIRCRLVSLGPTLEAASR